MSHSSCFSRIKIHIVSASLLGLSATAVVGQAHAASSNGCEGGGFSLILPGGIVSGNQTSTIAAAALGTRFLVKGKYVEYYVDSASFGILAYTMTGAANELDITGGIRTVVFDSKTPNHRGLSLTSGVSLQLNDSDIVISRTGPGLSMKIQSKDCANGGIFQMEPERADGATTVFTHTLNAGAFYYDNPNFRAREGDVVPYKDITATVTARINFGNDLSEDFVGRDSPQVATRIAPANGACNNLITKRDGTTVIVNHCGGVSVWRVSSGGRMGQVMGADSTEVAPPATTCTQNCQAQNQVRGRAVNLGAPFPVPASSRLKPRTSL